MLTLTPPGSLERAGLYLLKEKEAGLAGAL
jgi:hypothetical protein